MYFRKCPCPLCQNLACYSKCPGSTSNPCLLDLAMGETGLAVWGSVEAHYPARTK